MNDVTADRMHVQSAIDREVELVTSAIDLVATGGAPSAMVGGLRLATAVLEIVTTHAREAGVTLEPLWSADETLTDIRVRRGPAA
jgi:hypothetical protein